MNDGTNTGSPLGNTLADVQRSQRNAIERPPRVDFTRATEVTRDVNAAIEDAFTYHPRDEAQISDGSFVREAIKQAVKVIIAHVPPCPDRTTAIRKLREARMDCNSAITHGGKY